MSAPRILIVDDDEATRLLIARIVTVDLGAQASAVGSGEEALRRLALEPFDLILLDLSMPGIDGGEVLERLRAPGSAQRTVPVLIVSIVSDFTTMNRCLALGANGYVIKPIVRSTLADNVRKLLDGSPGEQPTREMPDEAA